MRKIAITAQEKINMIILSEPDIQEKTKQLYNNMEEKFRERYDEIIAYLHVEPINEFAYEKILKFFDPAFLYEILQIAVEKAITTEGKYNLKENILECLTEDNLNEAIIGEPMIEAFKDAINSLPAEDAYEHAHRGALLYNLTTKCNEEIPLAYIQNALKKDVPFDELLPGFRESLAKDIEEEMTEEEVYSAKQKCTVKRDDEKAKKFYEGWPNVFSPQWKDGQYLGCKKFVEGEESNDSKEELKGIREYLKEDIDD